MRTIQLIAFAAIFSMPACAQEVDQNQIPSVILNSFQSKFPNAQDVEWEKKGANYNIEFEIGNVDHEIWLDAEGKEIKHETDIAKNDLPAAIQSAISKDYASYRFDDADKIEKDGKTYYFVELDGNMGERNILFDSNGKEVADHSVIY